jgi:hypothetical protein
MLLVMPGLLLQLSVLACARPSPGEPPPPPPGTRTGWYVRTTGTPQGNGSDTLPWSLQYALDGAAINPGDTLWIRGGDYVGTFYSSLTGSSAAPIIVSAYPGERVTLTTNSLSNEQFTVDGSWVNYWGLEIVNTNTTRTGDMLGVRPTGVYVQNAHDLKFINFVVHDAGHGTYTEPDAGNIEIYGWIVYNGGHQWVGSRSDGHGLYVKNLATAGKKIFRDNVIFDQFGFGIHGYTGSGSSGKLQHMVFEGNVSFNNSTTSDDVNPNFQIGGDNIANFDTVRNNLFYFSPSATTDYNVRVGYPGGPLDSVAVFRDNYVVNGNPAVEVSDWTDLKMLNNTFIGSAMMTRQLDGTPSPAQNWAGNMFYRDPAATAWRFNGSNLNFATWKTNTSLSATDNAVAGTPSAPFVMVRPHQYLPGAAMVAIVNWGGAATVPVSLAGIGLSTGLQFEVRNVMNLWGSPVLTGTYTGAAVNFPMSAVAPPLPIGGSPHPPITPGPQFNVFIVRKL